MRDRKELNKKTKKKQKELNEQLEKEGGLEKKDMLAMIGSAYLTIFPICLLIIVGLGLFMLWLFKAL